MRYTVAAVLGNVKKSSVSDLGQALSSSKAFTMWSNVVLAK